MTTTRIGKYELVRRLGGGGMAEVFLAKTIGVEGFARPVAIKRVLPSYSADHTFAQMFINEARLSAGLRHANIVSTLDFDRDDEGRLFLVMELVEGKDLDNLVETGPLPWSVVIYVIGEVLRGLGAAHDATSEQGRPLGIVHRDVSPHNVLLSWDGAVKVSDFGIAKAFQATGAQHSGMIKGKASYMSPEQIKAEVLDGRSDVFAVGVMLHQMLTGRPLFRGDTVEQVLSHAIQVANGHEHLPWPHQLRAEVPLDLSEVAMTMLATERANRYPHARDAMAALKKCRDASLHGPELLAQVLAERFAGQAPARHGVTPAPGVGTAAEATPPPRPAMLSSPNQVTWMAPSVKAAIMNAETNTRGTPPAYASIGPTDARQSAAKRRGLLSVGIVAAIMAAVAIVLVARHGGANSPVAPGNAAAPPAATVDAPPAPIAVPDAAPAAAAPDAAPQPAVDAAPPSPVDAGSRSPPGRRRGPAAPAGPGSGNGPGSGIQEIKIGGGA